MKIKLSLLRLMIPVLVISACALRGGPIDGVYLIPKGYQGSVFILFNQPDGVTPAIENGLYVYSIPESGILKVKPAGVKGMINLNYFYVDKSNERQRIASLRITGDRNPDGLPQNKYGNISQNEYENGVFVMNASGLGELKTKNGVIHYRTFIIGAPKDSDHLYDEMQKRIASFQLPSRPEN